MAVLTDEAKEYLTEFYGDLTAYITNKIEAEVQLNKTALPIWEGGNSNGIIKERC